MGDNDGEIFIFIIIPWPFKALEGGLNLFTAISKNGTGNRIGLRVKGVEVIGVRLFLCNHGGEKGVEIFAGKTNGNGLAQSVGEASQNEVIVVRIEMCIREEFGLEGITDLDGDVELVGLGLVETNGLTGESTASLGERFVEFSRLLAVCKKCLRETSWGIDLATGNHLGLFGCRERDLHGEWCFLERYLLSGCEECG